MTATTATSTPRAPRRYLGLTLALAGAIVALLYGQFVLHLGFGAPLIVLGLGGISLGYAGLTIFRVLQPLFEPSPPQDAVEGPRGAARVKELEREKTLVLKAIREVEHDYQMRKTSEADYKEMTQRYRARAMRLMRELDIGDDYRVLIEQELKTRLAALDAAAQHTCKACNTVNDGDAEFCKKCGAAIEAGATA